MAARNAAKSGNVPPESVELAPKSKATNQGSTRNHLSQQPTTQRTMPTASYDRSYHGHENVSFEERFNHGKDLEEHYVPTPKQRRNKELRDRDSDRQDARRGDRQDKPRATWGEFGRRAGIL